MVIGVEEMKLKVVFFSTSFYRPVYDCFIYGSAHEHNNASSNFNVYIIREISAKLFPT